MRFRAHVSKHFAQLIKTYDETTCFKDEAYRELFEFIGVTAPSRHQEPSAVSTEDNTEDDEPLATAETRQTRFVCLRSLSS